jgi:hypothetical protein
MMKCSRRRLDSSSAPLYLAPLSRVHAPHPHGKRSKKECFTIQRNHRHCKLAKRKYVEQSGTRTLDRVNGAQVRWLEIELTTHIAVLAPEASALTAYMGLAMVERD